MKGKKNSKSTKRFNLVWFLIGFILIMLGFGYMPGEFIQKLIPCLILTLGICINDKSYDL